MLTVQSMCCLPISNGTISMAARSLSAATRAPVGVVQGRITELLTTEASDKVCVTHGSLHSRRQVLQDGITSRVPVGVVDLLEVVHINDQQREALVVAGDAVEFCL